MQGMVVLPYVQGVTELILARTLKQYDNASAMKKRFSWFITKVNEIRLIYRCN